MSQIAVQDTTSNQTSGVVKKRAWGRLFISAAFGGTVAVIAAPTIVAGCTIAATFLLPLGAWSTIAATVTGTVSTGVLGSVVTKISGNLIDAEEVTLTIQLGLAQQFYRRVLRGYIGNALDDVLLCIQMNRALRKNGRVGFEIGDDFAIQNLKAQEKRRMFIQYNIRVIPKDGTKPREKGEGIAPPDLPDFDHNATMTETVGVGNRWHDGLGSAVLEGAAFGAIGGGIAHYGKCAGMTPIRTVGNVNILAGVASATGIASPVKNLTFRSEEKDKITLFMEFIGEVEKLVSRLVHCAVSNDVGLEVHMTIRSASRQLGQLSQPTNIAAVHDDICYWETNIEL